VSGRLPPGLAAYRLLSAAAEPAAALLLGYRLRRGKEIGARLEERRGLSALSRPAGPLIWLHGASVGELLGVMPLIERLSERGFNLLVTSGTVTSSGIAAQRLPPGVIHQFVPFDVPRFVARFLDRWRPQLALFVESDLWPNMLIETAARQIPIALINARLSERSFRRWRRLPAAIGDLLQRFDLVLARTPVDAERLHALGAPRTLVSGNLKLDAPAPPADADKLVALQAAIGARPLIAAASTHPGEDEFVVAAHRELRDSHPGLLSVIAPRHPERGPQLEALARSAGFATAVRSRGELPGVDTEIYVADTMGELGLLYRVAPLVFVGGSLIRHGGQNPIEPAKLGIAIVHGPHVWNFAEIYAALDRASGAIIVAQGERLGETIGELLRDPERRARIAAAGHALVEASGGALTRTLDALEPYLASLQQKTEPAHA
jgi:3-deoxy-D-manno-octulosonic-acid transferase